MIRTYFNKDKKDKKIIRKNKALFIATQPSVGVETTAAAVTTTTDN